MEPLDTDLEYVAREPRPATRESRLGLMLIFPALGFLLMLIFILSAIFQWDLSDLIDSLVGLLLLLFFAFIGMLFWAFAPRAEEKA
jgi:drug/metabolite transporter (DMT)-like permease